MPCSQPVSDHDSMKLMQIGWSGASAATLDIYSGAVGNWMVSTRRKDCSQTNIQSVLLILLNMVP